MKLTLQWLGVFALISICTCLILIQIDIHIFTGVEEFISHKTGYIERKTGLFSLAEVINNESISFEGPSFLFAFLFFFLIPMIIAYSVFSKKFTSSAMFSYNNTNSQTREAEFMGAYSFTHPRRGEFAYAKFSRSTNYKA